MNKQILALKKLIVGHLYRCSEEWPLYDTLFPGDHEVNISKNEPFLCVEKPNLSSYYDSWYCKILYKDVTGFIVYHGGVFKTPWEVEDIT
jgi:hypothetical protein